MKYHSDKTISRILFVSMALVSLVPIGHAQILAYDGFAAGTDSAMGQYLPGADDRHFLTGQEPATPGFTGAWGFALAQFELGNPPIPSLGYSDGTNNLATSGNAAFRKFNDGTSFRSLGVPNLSADGTTAYFSFLLKLDDATAQGRVEFSESSSSFGNGLRIRTTSGNFVATVNNASTTLAAADTHTHLFVWKVDFGSTDTWSLWMNPDLSTEGTPTLTGSVTGPASLDLTHLVLQREGGGTTGNGFIVDEIRIGSTWGDVTPIPEPSTYALIAGVFVFAGMIIRRKFRA